MHRRAFLLCSVVAACTRRRAEERCAHCGMKIDPASAWRAEVVGEDGSKRSFDTPRCALTSLARGGKPFTGLRVQEFYSRAWRDASELVFVVGSDVDGPMGPDLVPVEPAKAAKFATDHAAKRVLEVRDVGAYLREGP